MRILTVLAMLLVSSLALAEESPRFYRFYSCAVYGNPFPLTFDIYVDTAALKQGPTKGHAVIEQKSYAPVPFLVPGVEFKYQKIDNNGYPCQLAARFETVWDGTGMPSKFNAVVEDCGTGMLGDGTFKIESQGAPGHVDSWKMRCQLK